MVVVVVVLFGAACGSSGDDSSTSTAATIEPSDDAGTDHSDNRSPAGPPSPPPPPPPPPRPEGGISTAALVAEECYWGDMPACDYLAEGAAPDGSDEHVHYGQTCGGRLDESRVSACRLDIDDPEFPPPLPPTPPPSGNPTYDGMAAACSEGQMQACNDLTNQGTNEDPGPGAPLGSNYYDYGDTCGGRTPPQHPVDNCLDLTPVPN
jgi:hypothetical protein